MSTHTFRNPELFQQLPYRDWIRAHMPNGRDGFVTEDLDLVIRTFGPNYRTTSTGRVMLVELKHGNATINEAQVRTFGMLDTLMRASDPAGHVYRGFFLVQTDVAEWDDAEAFFVNKYELTPNEFKRWLSDDLQVPTWQFPHHVKRGVFQMLAERSRDAS